MAGATMTFTETTVGSVKKIKCAWLSDDGTGAVSGTTTFGYSGRIIGATTIPGAAGAAPDPNYDITLADADSGDLALGGLLNRHTSNTEHVLEAAMAGVASGKITVSVAAAGNANSGTLYLYIR